MEELCFSIDEERYDDRHGHILSLDGWYIHPEKRECGFVLLGDGYEKIDLPEIEHRERPDVLTALNTDCGEVLPGFTVHIPEVLKLMEKFGDLELFLTEGDNRISIWSINAEDLH